MSDYTYCVIHGDETVIDNPGVMLRWTSELPNWEGLYWLSVKIKGNWSKPELIEVFTSENSGECYVEVGRDDDHCSVNDYISSAFPKKWLGPLPIAELPKE